MANLPCISIIGPGKVGTAVGILAARAGYRVAALAGRDESRATEAARAIDPGVRASDVRNAAGAGELVLLTTPDDAIEGLCRDLAEAKAFRRGAVVAHCCGALGSDVLAPARQSCGCAVGSMHPLQTFPTSEAAVARLPGAWCFVEGDAPAVEQLEALATAIGAKAVRIDPSAKVLYHAAAVTACNYITSLLDASGRLAQQAGIERETFLAAAEPIIRATVDNVAAMGPAAALTGPVARGDVETVRRHLRAIAPCETCLRVAYRAMGILTVDLAQRSGAIDDATATRLHGLFQPDNAGRQSKAQPEGVRDDSEDHRRTGRR